MAALYFLQKCLKSSAKRPLTLWSAMTMVTHYVWFSPLCSHFRGTIHWSLASKAKINFFWNVFEWSSPKKGPEEWKKIIDQPKTHFLTFSSKSKLIKITHSAMLCCGVNNLADCLYCVCVCSIPACSIFYIKWWVHSPPHTI